MVFLPARDAPERPAVGSGHSAFRSCFVQGPGGILDANVIQGALMPRTALSRFAAILALVVVLPAASWAAVSRDEAATLAQHIVPGRVLAVERGVHVDNSVVWRVRLVTATGELRVLVIDAETGRSR
jgi:hypothetical protein